MSRIDLWAHVPTKFQVHEILRIRRRCYGRSYESHAPEVPFHSPFKSPTVQRRLRCTNLSAKKLNDAQECLRWLHRISAVTAQHFLRYPAAAEVVQQGMSCCMKRASRLLRRLLIVNV